MACDLTRCDKISFFGVSFVALVLLLSFRVFFSFPGMLSLDALWIVFLILFVTLIYSPWKLLKKEGLLAFELYVAIIVLVLPLYTGWRASDVFGQPIIYGVLAERSLILCTSALLLYFSFLQGWINCREIERAFMVSAWGCLIIYSLMNMLIDPSSLAANDDSRIIISRKLGFGSIVFDLDLIVFGFLYYSLAAVRTGSYKLGLYALIFLGYILFTGERSLLVAILLVFAFFTVRRYRIERLLTLLPKLLLLALLAPLIFYLISPDAMVTMIERFEDALLLVFSGKLGNDYSANARILESAIAMQYVPDYWLVGVGHLSHQWNGGNEGALGYFFASDIGLLGVIYRYGFIWLLFFCVQFLLARQMHSRIHSEYYPDFHVALFAFMIYIGLHSLATGRLAFSIEVSCMVIGVLWILLLGSNKMSPGVQYGR